MQIRLKNPIIIVILLNEKIKREKGKILVPDKKRVLKVCESHFT